VPTDLPYHYPTELIQLLTEAIPALCPGKRDVLVFFKSAGIPPAVLSDHVSILDNSPEKFRKHIVTKSVLTRLNARGDGLIRERRELLKRIVEWHDFTTCWPDERDKAEALVARIRSLVGAKDAITRINEEREREAAARRATYRAELEKKQATEARRQELLDELRALYSERNAQLRGKKLEKNLNGLFDHYGMLVREAFERRDPELGCLEQVDGVIEADSHLWLVEMKWHADKLGPDHIHNHMGRVFSRGEVRGVLVSASGYTDAAIEAARTANVRRLCVLFELREVLTCVEGSHDLREVLKAKAAAASLDKNPLHRAWAR
jgi:hypothetical protein